MKRWSLTALVLVILLTAVNVVLTLGVHAPAAFATGAPRRLMPVFRDAAPVPSLAPMIRAVTPAVVNIATRGTIPLRTSPFAPLFQNPFFGQFFGGMAQAPLEQHFEALGSGVIINAKKGYILTNYHVIRHAHSIVVTTYNNDRYRAHVVGFDRRSDLAVLRIHAHHLQQIVLGHSSRLEVGDFVVAIGNPFGLEHTATFGIVSGLGRTNIGKDEDDTFIQTDAAINPGNSGGALVDLRGHLVGINTAILTENGGGNIGIGFAIPIGLARQVMDQIIKYGHVKRGILGVYVEDLSPHRAEALGLPRNTQGALVTEVLPGSGAAHAGVRQYDVIVSVNGRPVDNISDLEAFIGVKRVGTVVRLGILRHGRRIHLNVRLGSPSKTSTSVFPKHIDLGIALSNITPGSPLYGRVHGVLVVGVNPEGPAARANPPIDVGDVITAVNERPVANLAQFRAVLAHARGILLLTVQRGSQVFVTTVPLTK
jgi:Do/DeqQ family serine protease